MGDNMVNREKEVYGARDEGKDKELDKIKEKRLKKIWGSMFVLGLIFLVIFSDIILTRKNPLANSTLFRKNDYEKIRISHPEEKYEKVFYGNSVVISAFKEEDSRSGYINMGIDYGVISDLHKMIEKDMIQIASDLVIGVNYLVFLDSLDTNPNYLWHKKNYEPYFYFQRDKLHTLLTSSLDMILNESKLEFTRYTNFNRSIYKGLVSDEEMEKKIERYKATLWNKNIEEYQENFKDLQNIIDYCNEENIRLRLIIMPWNDYIEKPRNVILVEEKIKEILESNSIEYIDISQAYTKDYFHDLGHLNYEFGAEEFTKDIDKWLMGEGEWLVNRRGEYISD